MSKQYYKHLITRTIEIEVDCVYYPDYGEAEVLSVTDCATGAVVQLEDDEESQCLNEGAAEHIQDLAEQAAELRDELRREEGE